MKHLSKNFKTIILSALCGWIGQISSAQTTGSFTRTVTFNGSSRTLYYYVPANYNASNRYKLVVGLHGLGDTPKNFRDYLLVNSQMTSCSVYNSIVVCYAPAGGANGDFWSPVSDTGMVTKAIADAMSAYNIDPGYIILTGFSLGGRAALRYGLYTYWRFRGMELWTPAIQSSGEANNQTSFKYAWQNGKHIPICMTVGGSDGQYNNRVATAYQHLVDSGAVVNLNIVYGMGHDAPPDSIQFACFAGLSSGNASLAANDAGVSNVATPFDEECSSSFVPVVSLQNKGVNNLTSATLNYQVDNGTVNTYNWAGNMKRIGISTITLPSQSVSAGVHTFSAYTTMPNGTADALASNDGVVRNFKYITAGGNMSVSENFEGTLFPPAGWKNSGTDKAWMWSVRSKGKSGGFGQSKSCIYFDNAIPNNTGKKYSIRTAQYDFTNAISPTLSYDYAYVPSISQSVTYDDTLVVYYSTDCGSTWTSILKKGGTALNTTAVTHIDTVFVPTASQWKTEIINLPVALIGQPEVMFSFEDRARWGNMLYLDNINLSAVTGIGEAKSGLSFSVYPNPTSGLFQLSVAGDQLSKKNIAVINILGEIIYQVPITDDPLPRTIDFSSQPDGIYFVQMKTGNGIEMKKIIINR